MILNPLGCNSKQLGIVSLLRVAVLLQYWSDAVRKRSSDSVSTRIAILLYQHNVVGVKPWHSWSLLCLHSYNDSFLLLSHDSHQYTVTQLAIRSIGPLQMLARVAGKVEE